MKILIIDDEVEVADILALILGEGSEREIVCVSDARAAVDVFQQFQPDLVVLDLIMPGLSGLEVLAQLKTHIPPATHLPILVVSGDARVETRAQALREGASDFVVKPYDTEEIRARVKNLLEMRCLHLQLATKREELGAMVAELIKANAIKSEFLSRASHELRTPMNHILGFAQLLEADILTPVQEECVREILSGGRQLLQLIDRILAVAKSDLDDLDAAVTPPSERRDIFPSDLE